VGPGKETAVVQGVLEPKGKYVIPARRACPGMFESGAGIQNAFDSFCIVFRAPAYAGVTGRDGASREIKRPDAKTPGLIILLAFNQ
jgi:hypothetical protein